MRVKPLILAMIACCCLQSAVAAEIQANVARKAILPLNSPPIPLKAGQQTTQARGCSCAVVILDDGVPVVASIELKALSILSRRTAS